eukprot:COSAG02_NODE_1240_length_13709_cov_14.174798_2_plen_95_part_00
MVVISIVVVVIPPTSDIAHLVTVVAPGHLGDTGQYQCIPVVCDKLRGLYWLYYAIGKSRADIVHQVKQLESNGTDVRRMIKDGALMVVHRSWFL